MKDVPTAIVLFNPITMASRVGEISLFLFLVLMTISVVSDKSIPQLCNSLRRTIQTCLIYDTAKTYLICMLRLSTKFMSDYKPSFTWKHLGMLAVDSHFRIHWKGVRR